jgi:hypothetical protein
MRRPHSRPNIRLPAHALEAAPRPILSVAVALAGFVAASQVVCAVLRSGLF